MRAVIRRILSASLWQCAAIAIFALSCAAAPTTVRSERRDTSVEISPNAIERGARTDFKLKCGVLEGLIKERGEKKARGALKISIADLRGNVVDSSPEIRKLSRDVITFRWTAALDSGAYTAIISLDGKPLDAERARIEVRTGSAGSFSDPLSLRAEIEKELRMLFETYMREDGYAFVARLHPNFFGTAENGVSLTSHTVRTSVEDDFRNYDEIYFDWSINSIREYEKGKIVEVEVTWNERYKNATGSNAGVETRRLSKVTKFTFLREGVSLRLSTWQGAAAFGLAAPGGVGGS